MEIIKEVNAYTPVIPKKNTHLLKNSLRTGKSKNGILGKHVYSAANHHCHHWTVYCTL